MEGLLKKEIKVPKYLIIILIFLLAVGLFFYPKQNYLVQLPFSTGKKELCSCFGFTDRESGFDTINSSVCYGIIYSCIPQREIDVQYYHQNPENLTPSNY
ncbi:hypothetical protein A3J43_02905 [Candidatus Uhrbacteria bacterium RIFCSPHIGHO2_12_FULL_54_23]|uniref:Uncharacterized protein n=3 Tax=Candidatus Uhriibacteriota TaxID=1752732 RepID=A0A1F7UJJ7_9BACT|nr:MAG: hypothetical protein A3J43_02905 [Candidatus Uhrbacteria bacterium RIFCSPHIGHO2_12_FULL_54_23]OGL85537.1 MAG: hypothetical protein A3B36_00555 [Candidatus Uhrbacteria bacterium RIFCSPLOWO2_01_FULL_55_36]OGL89623.1 MAG: hypothetical protein A3J36_01135 [Candidatus Uhrbacteria bacterium RIFCSPLOWO2_02_FULL_54_37]